MIKTVTQLNILHSTIHLSYRSSKGKIEQALHIGNHSTGITLRDPFRVLMHLILLLVLYLLELLLHLQRLLLHLRRHLLRHLETRLPMLRKASWILLLKPFLLASTCVARTPRRSVSIGDIWKRNSSSWRGGKRKLWQKLSFLFGV